MCCWGTSKCKSMSYNVTKLTVLFKVVDFRQPKQNNKNPRGIGTLPCEKLWQMTLRVSWDTTAFGSKASGLVSVI